MSENMIKLKTILKLLEKNKFKSKKNYTAVNDAFFTEKKYFSLGAIYHLTLSYPLCVSQTSDPLFIGSENEQYTGMIFKLDNDYYLTAINGCDGYRDERGFVYHMKFDEEKLISVLAQHTITNKIPFAIDIKVVKDFTEEQTGIVFIIGDYAEKEENILVSLTTNHSDSYYPSGHIYFNDIVLQNAKEYIESTYFEDALKKITPNNQKIKL
jgi:hypothetical protein